MIISFLLVGIAVAILIAFFIIDRDIIRIEWDSVSAFLSMLALLTVARIVGYDFMYGHLPIYEKPLLNDAVQQIEVWRLGLVFWEDVVFGLSIFLLLNYLQKPLAIMCIILLSALFAVGHAYQGAWVVFVTSLYPYFVSYNLGMRFGFGTVMVCHVFYDIVTYFTIINLPWLT